MVLGRKGEELVCQTLEKQNFKILHRNFRTPEGEVDIVASLEGTLYIFEVKTRQISVDSKGRQSREVSFLNWKQRKRLEKAARWLWIKYRGDFKFFRCALIVVTKRGIKWTNLPLLYDQA